MPLGYWKIAFRSLCVTTLFSGPVPKSNKRTKNSFRMPIRSENLLLLEVLTSVIIVSLPLWPLRFFLIMGLRSFSKGLSNRVYWSEVGHSTVFPFPYNTGNISQVDIKGKLHRKRTLDRTQQLGKSMSSIRATTSRLTLERRLTLFDLGNDRTFLLLFPYLIRSYERCTLITKEKKILKERIKGVWSKGFSLTFC